jgi:hypothetical protein
MVEILVATDIDAPPEVVWSILTDLPRFGEWNPFIREARGTLEPGGDVRVRVQTSAGPSLRLPFRAKILERAARRELHWVGSFLSPAMARGEHWFLIAPEKSGRSARFVQREVFTGVLPWLFRGLLARETRRGFLAMNSALKARAEGAPSASPRVSCAPEDAALTGAGHA